MPRLLVKRRAEVIADYRISGIGTVNIGSVRANEIYIPAKNISENHCTITKVNNAYEIKDNNTLTGTTVNGKPITISELKLGDEIGLGSFSIAFLPDVHTLVRTEEEAELGEPKKNRRFLLGIYGKFEGKKYEIRDEGTYIGREKTSPKGAENDIVLTGDMTVSKGHAKIDFKDNNYYLQDVGSTGGVAVNGKKVGQLNEVVLNSRDEIAIGHTIFRMVDDGKDDYSLPKNHRIFLLKIRAPLFLLAVLLSIGAAFFLGYTGLKGIKISKAKVRKISFEVDSKFVPAGNALRTPPSEYDITGSCALGDLNNVGTNDVVFLSPSGYLYAWDGKTGAQLWKTVEIFNSGKSSPVIHDMNGDGIPDIICVSDTSMLYIIDGKTGGIIKKEVLGGAVSELSPCVADIDGDGKPDVVVCSEEGMVHFLYDPGYDAEFEKYTEFVEGPIYASPVILAAEKISPMVLVSGYNSKMFFFDGKTRAKKTLNLLEKTGKPHLLCSSPAVGDLNGDGIPEVVVQSNVPQYLSAIDITSFAVNWTYFVEPVPPSGIKHNSSPIIIDSKGDGLGNIAFVSANGYLYLLRGKTGYPAGELLSKTKIPDGGKMTGSLSLYDFDKDGIVDLVFGTEDGAVVIARGQYPSNEFEIADDIKVSNEPITSSVLIGDVAGTERVGLLVSSVSNSIHLLKSNLKTFKNNLIWPEFLGGPARAGATNIKENNRPYVIRLGAGIFIFIGLITFYFVNRKRRYSKRPKVAYL